MRLRTRLALAFSLLALLPIALLVPLTLSELRKSLSREYENRLQRATDAAHSELLRLDDDVRRRMTALAEGPGAENVAKAEHAHTPVAQLSGAAVGLMQSERLTVLVLLDAGGSTLSSAHLPARVGDSDPALYALTGTPGVPHWTGVEVRGDHGIETRPALVCAHAIDYGEVRLWAVGGVQLDGAVAEQLARLTGAQVRVLFEGTQVAEAGEALPPRLARTVEVAPGVTVQLGFSGAALEAAERRVTWVGSALGGLGLVLAVLLGFFVARVTTGPLEALSAGARRVSGGDWQHPVVAEAGGEVGELIRTFNAMTENLSRTTDKLIAAERVAAWQEMAKRLAHELKNPLTPIKMSLETLLAAYREKDARFAGLFAESAGPMLEEVERLRRTVDAFSSFARMPKPNLGPLEVSEWAGQVLALHASSRATLKVKTELAPELHVLGDRDQLTQVLVNLIKNADEAMGSDGGRLSLRTRRVGDDVVLEVEDTGPGVPVAARGQLFTPYFTTKEGGTGLGLAISARICQEHGGRLELEAASARGATFRMVLPAV